MTNKDYVIQERKNPFFTIIKIIVSIIALVIMIGLKNSVKVNNLAFANIIGLDKSPNDPNNIVVTFQFVTPKMKSGNSVSTDKTIVTSVEEKSINLAISSLQDYMNSNLSFSNANAIIISENLAKEGVHRYISEISSNLKFNTNMYILICENSSQKFIETLDKNNDLNPTSGFNILKNSEEYTGSIDVINITEFEDFLYTKNASPRAPICKINSEESKDENKKDDMNKESNESSQNNKSSDTSDIVDNISNNTGGVIKQKSDIKVEVGGTAVFDDDKLVGKLSCDETAMHIMLTSTLESYDISLEKKDTKINNNQNSPTNINLSQTKKAKIKVTTNNFNARADIEIPLNMIILSNPVGVYNYTNKDYMENLKYQTEEILNTQMDNYLKKIQKEYNTDIDDFYSYTKKNFLTYNEYLDYNFKQKFKDMKINVKFKITYTDSGLNLKK